MISDNCTSVSDLTVESSDGAVSGTCQKTFMRTYKVIDKCGNFITVSLCLGTKLF